MALVARGTFASSNLAFQGENVMLSFPVATDKNQDNLSYSIQYTTQPIYCNTIGESYICSESTDEVVVSSWENITAFTEDGGIISTVRAMPTFSTDVVLKFVIRATDSITGGGDEPTKTSGDIYLVRNAFPALQMSTIDWTAEENIIANGIISNLGTTCPANYTTIANTAAWTNWRAGIVTALGGNITFTYKYSYSIDNISYSTPAVVNASYNFNLTYDWLQNRNFALTINNSSRTFNSSNSYYIKIYLVSSMYTVSSGLNPATLPQLLLNRMPVFNIKKGTIKINMPQNDTARTGGLMVAHGAQQISGGSVSEGDSISLYDSHTESGVAIEEPSLGFYSTDHIKISKISISKNSTKRDLLLRNIWGAGGDIRFKIDNGGNVLIPSGAFFKESPGAGEGGDFLLYKPTSSTSLSSNIRVDINGNLLRFYESGGTSRGFYLDFTTAAASIGSKIWHSGNQGALSGLDADLLDGNHATAFALASHTHNYLPLGGGTLTGALTGTDTTMNNITVNTQIMLPFYAGSAYIGKGSADGVGYSGNTTNISCSKGLGFYNSINSGAYPLALSGYLDFQNGILDMKGGFKVNGAVVWNSDNDGVGSGLDADRVNGMVLSASGDRWGVMPWIMPDGALEIGKYIDFHDSDGDTSDYSLRLESVSGKLRTNGYEVYTTNTTVAIANGGTGQTSASAAFDALAGIYGSSLAANTNYSISIGNGGIVRFYWYGSVGDVGDIKMYINGDTTAGNYTCSYNYSGVSTNCSSDTIVTYSVAVSSKVAVIGTIFVNENKVFISGEGVRSNGVRGHFFHTHAGPISSLRFTQDGTLYLKRG